MKKKLTIKQRWDAKTPKFARWLQVLSSAITALPLYYTSLPDEFKASLPVNVILYISGAGLAVTFLLNLFNTKEK